MVGKFGYFSSKIDDNTFRYRFGTTDGSEFTYRNFIDLLKSEDKDFFPAFQGALKDANTKFPAYFWKCPPVSLKTLNKPFQFVVIKGNIFNNAPRSYFAFEEHFGKR